MGFYETITVSFCLVLVLVVFQFILYFHLREDLNQLKDNVESRFRQLKHNYDRELQQNQENTEEKIRVFRSSYEEKLKLQEENNKHLQRESNRIFEEKIKQQNDKYERKLKEFLEEHRLLQTDVAELREGSISKEQQMRIYVNERTEELSEIIRNLSAQQTPLISFSAFSTVAVNVGPNEKVVFSRALLNYGGGYDVGSGIFIASFGGTYLFLVHVCTISGMGCSGFAVVRNNDEITKSNICIDSWREKCVSMHAIVNACVGDRIWVQTTDGGQYFDRAHAPTFVGFLIKSHDTCQNDASSQLRRNVPNIEALKMITDFTNGSQVSKSLITDLTDPKSPNH